ncbi:MAG: Na/Pi cotransporter family protein, partial [Acidimicrobiia bacterium]|nr:Na/Pi cotransporter family protein [Acidimicrobiia bacterium]
LIERLVPDHPEDEAGVVRVRYLDKTLLRTPSLALDRARLELLRMADRVRAMYADVLPALLTGSRWTLLEIGERDEEVDSLHSQIIEFLGQISQTRLSEGETQELIGLMEATNDLEAIGDLIETNLVGLGLRRTEQGISISPETTDVLTEFHGQVAEALDLAMLALTQKNPDAARRASKMKRQVNSLERAAAAHQAERLVVDAPDRVATYRLEIDVIASFKRIYYFAKRIARVSVPHEERAAIVDD